MKRLTLPPVDYSEVGVVENMRTSTLAAMICKLSAYEDISSPEEFMAYKDTGLTAEQIKNGINGADDLARIAMALRKLRRYEYAEQKRNLVALPCKVGDIVYAIVFWEFANTPTVLPTAVRSLTIHDDHISVTYDKRINTIGDCGVWGKTVFSSREEAQAELERRYAN